MAMREVYHPGELSVQSRAGVQIEASRIANSIHSTMPPVAQAFLLKQRMAIAGTVARGGSVWASLLTGQPGFMKAVDEQTVEIIAFPLSIEPLAENMRAGEVIGLLVTDLATRRRMRINGRIERVTPGKIFVHTQQVYSNCQKYIQQRHLAAENLGISPGRTFSRSGCLTPTQEAWIERADTFFIASAHCESGADASHRGGYPGFVRLIHAHRLIFPDYPGNMMFQTLGNISVNPHAGLLFLDFENGNTLQLTGRAQIIWDELWMAKLAGARRLVEFTIDEVIERAGNCPLRWSLVEYSPFLPK
jgi:uncharacterized protein